MVKSCCPLFFGLSASICLILAQATLGQLQVNLVKTATAINGINSTTVSPTNTKAVIVTALSSAINNASAINDEVKKFQIFKNSSYYLPSFEAEIIAIPQPQIDFIRKAASKDLDMLRGILREAIEKKNNFAPSMALMLKHGGKLLGTFIRNRREELKISPRIEPKPAFFAMLAKLAEDIIHRSNSVKKMKGYNKKNVNTGDLYKRVDAVFSYIERVIGASPVGAYLKWDEMVLFRNESAGSDRILLEEASDLTAVS